MPASNLKIAVLLLVVGTIFIACAISKSTDIKLPEEGAFFDQLSEYGIMDEDQSVHADLIKYEVTNELFTDYALKDRYVYLPEGQTAVLKEDGFFSWPEGAILVKNFGYSEEQIGQDKLIETRLLIKESNSWKAMSYKWNDRQSDARISKVGDIIELALHGETFDYVIPNKNQCKSCHNHNEKIDPLGFKYANLGGIDGQLEMLVDQGVIALTNASEGMKTMIAYTDESQPLQARALAYLDSNCGHCHRPEGPGNTSGLFLQFDEVRSNRLGFCKAPVAAGKGSGGRQFDVSPGAADASILYYRMASVDPGVMMPEVGRTLAHEEGLAVVGAWIDGLDKNNCN